MRDISRFHYLVKHAMRDRASIKLGNVEFWTEGNEVIYDIPTSKWDVDSVIRDLTAALKGDK